MLIIYYRVGDIVDIKANGAVQKGLVKSTPRTWKKRDSGREPGLEIMVKESDIFQYAT